MSSIYQGSVQLSPVGMAIMRWWQAVPRHYPYVRVHDIVVMPDHIHGIIEIVTMVTSPALRAGTSKSIGSVIRCVKIGVTKQTQA